MILLQILNGGEKFIHSFDRKSPHLQLRPFILVFCSIMFKHTKYPSFNIFPCVYIYSKLSFHKRKFTSNLFSEKKKNLSDVNFFLLFTLASESILPGQELQIKMSIRGSNILWLACFRQWRKLLKHLDKKLKIQSL